MKYQILATTFVASALVGCGGGGDDTVSGETALSAASSETAAALPAPADGISASRFNHRSIANGSFETGDTTGWKANIDQGYSGIFIPHERPAGTVSVVDSFNFGGTKLAYDGRYFLKACTGNEWFDGQGTYNITASQTVLLHKGDTVTGASSYYNGDFAAQDTVWVKIFDKSGNLKATPWIDFSGNGAPGDNNSVPYNHTSDWTTWDWTAPKTGIYTVKLGATTFGDNRFATCGFHDAITVVLNGKGKPAAAAARWPNGIPAHVPVFVH
ncbi:hypothetical protein [Azohydromonas australica]|uniref:hypothetical protein n=1 Tax=Azohydromonas australica TaxID=364039 RepID=UPI000401963E|nr:hypothetical protein [Azohydromonas australica]